MSRKELKKLIARQKKEKGNYQPPHFVKQHKGILPEKATRKQIAQLRKRAVRLLVKQGFTEVNLSKIFNVSVRMIYRYLYE